MSIYIFDYIAFTIGVFSVGCIYTLTKSNKNEIIRSYWIYYCLFSLFIGVYLLGCVMNKLGFQNIIVNSIFFSLQFLCLYLSLYVLEYMINKVYQVPYSGIKNTILFIITMAWWGLCSFKKFAIMSNNGFWIIIEDEVLIIVTFLYAIFTYCLYKKNIENKIWYRNTRKILMFVILCTPGLIFDGLTAGHGTPLHFTPIMFSVISIVNIHMINQYNQETQNAQYVVDNDFKLKYSITEREDEVIVLLLKGYSYAKIGELLFISISTVRTHVMNIYKKVGVKSRYELLNKIS